MIFRQLFEPDTCTYTYLLACERSRAAAIIDPVASEVDSYMRLLTELDLHLVYTLETHVHADHITGAGLLRERTGSRSVVHRHGGAACADVMVADSDVLRIGHVAVEVRHTPGHTAGCVSYVVGNRVFTGDSLLIGGCGRTDFQEGDPAKLYDSIHGKLFTLPAETEVFPGHDYRGNSVSSIGREKARNSRLGGGMTRESFIRIMENLDLPYPKYIDQALPANRHCGQGRG